MCLSLVITLYNEAENVKPLLEKIRATLQVCDYEIILVDDGSTDKTVDEVKKYADEHVQLIILNKNYGQTHAMAAGIDAAKGEYVVTLDGDLQNDPADIPMMLEKLTSEGWDVVAGVRKKRQDDMIVRKLPSLVANFLIRTLTDVHLHDYGCTLKVFRKQIAKNLGLYGQLHRFIPVLAKLQGAKITEVDVKHHARLHGKSKYGLGRTFNVASDILLMLFMQKYLQRPIHLFGTTGLFTFLIGFGINIYLLVLKILGEDIWGRPLLLAGVIFTIGGIQLITIGILAEILIRTYYESQNKKPYLIREIFTRNEKDS
ncbi:glycosyl transferase family 2 [Chloroherpeton thalassium ATCC 35110]|uniref:Glycosyl transferase family 2 n=1 Tax=Chloroherpeton thalassium (strain ATCC 35110 / GB-78) TaxID=517418 RepID=B3QTR5_CHLT3|nr:glycosyltransferase family 2 protein [Chloroherpeton thalassium]ACF14263.1 glycosyl transferase family 2 [Chloroherpeton thalassium ATCC 35110]